MLDPRAAVPNSTLWGKPRTGCLEGSGCSPGCGTQQNFSWQHTVPWQMPSASWKPHLPLAHPCGCFLLTHSPLAMDSLWITTCQFWILKLLVLKGNIQRFLPKRKLHSVGREELSKECKWRSSISAVGSVAALSVTQQQKKDKMKYQHTACDSTSHWHTDELGPCWFQSPGHILECQDRSWKHH